MYGKGAAEPRFWVDIEKGAGLTVKEGERPIHLAPYPEFSREENLEEEREAA